MPVQTPTFIPDRLANTPFVDQDGRVNRDWMRQLRDLFQIAKQIGTVLGEIQSDVPIVGREEGLGTTVQQLTSSGQLKDADQVAADGANFGRIKGTALTSNQVDLAKAGVIGLLGSSKVNINITSNYTNNATVDSIDNSTNATIRVYGPGGVGTSWHQQQGTVVGPELPGFSGTADYDTDYVVMYDAIADLFHLFTDGFSTLADGLIFAGAVHTVQAGGAGGVGGGGGPGGGTGGGGGHGRGFLPL